MAYTTINKSTDNFTPFTYSGNGSSITNVDATTVDGIDSGGF